MKNIEIDELINDNSKDNLLNKLGRKVENKLKYKLSKELRNNLFDKPYEIGIDLDDLLCLSLE